MIINRPLGESVSVPKKVEAIPRVSFAWALRLGIFQQNDALSIRVSPDFNDYIN